MGNWKTKQNKTKQNKTKQNKTKQNKTKQNKTKQMSNINIEDLLGSIKGAFNKGTGGGMYKDILKLEKNKTYIVRLVPNANNPANSLFPFTYYGWNSESTGSYIEFINPEVFGKPNPLRKMSYEAWDVVKNLPDDHPDKKKAKKLWKKFACLVNVYVISDETNQDNNGKVKMLRMGKQLYDIVNDAFQGDEADEYGIKIWDLSPNGCNLKIRVTENDGGFANYQKSKFMMPSSIEDIGDDQEVIQDVWGKIFDLATVYPVKSFDAIKELVAIHYNCEEVKKESKLSKKHDKEDDDENEDVSYDDISIQKLVKSKKNVKEVDEEEEEKEEKPVKAIKKEKTSKKREEEESEEFDVDAFLDGIEKD